MTPEQIYPNAFQIEYIEPEEGFAVATYPYENGLYGVAVLAISGHELASGNEISPFLLLTLFDDHDMAINTHRFFVEQINRLYADVCRIQPLQIYKTPTSNNPETPEIDEIIASTLKFMRKHRN